MEKELTLEEQVADLCFRSACRALLGDGKGMFVMLELYDQSPEHYHLIMKVAKEHLIKNSPQLVGNILRNEKAIEALTQDLERERGN